MDRYLTALERVRQRDPSSHRAQLYLLLDGHQFLGMFGQPVPAQASFSLFEGLEEEPLAHAGPWLLAADEHPQICEHLSEAEASQPLCTWLISSLPVRGLGQVLQLSLVAELADGRQALLRLQDPRVLYRLATSLTGEQQEALMAHVDEWHFVCDGQHRWIGS